MSWKARRHQPWTANHADAVELGLMPSPLGDVVLRRVLSERAGRSDTQGLR